MSQFLSRLFANRSEPAWIDPPDLVACLRDAAPLVVDVRGPDEFTGPLGHIDGAMNVPLGEIPANTAALGEQTRPIVLVCHTDRRSSAAAVHLHAAGIPKVAVLRGGMLAWREMGST
jgi:rhodanese-related sulfurtransferase